MKDNPMTLMIRAKGEIVSTNYPEFSVWVRSGLDSVNMDLTTDDEFVEADSVVKNLTLIEDGIKSAKDAMLRDAKSLYDILTEMDGLCADTARVRLALSKQITKRKDEVRAELLSTAMESLDCSPNHRHHFARSLGEAIKGKKNLDSIQRSLCATVSIHNGMIRRSRSIIVAHVAAHGLSLVMDAKELEIKTPDSVEAELRRRVECHASEVERNRLRAEADAARAEAARLAREHAAREHAKPAPEPALPIAPRTITTEHRSNGPDRVVVSGDTGNPVCQVAEWMEFWNIVAAAFAPVKEAKGKLRHEANIRAANILSYGVNESAKEAMAHARQGVSK